MYTDEELLSRALKTLEHWVPVVNAPVDHVATIEHIRNRLEGIEPERQPIGFVNSLRYGVMVNESFKNAEARLTSIDLVLKPSKTHQMPVYGK